MKHPSEHAHLFELPLAERPQLVEDLWDSIAAESGGFEVSAAVMNELHERRARHEADPSSGLSWGQVKQRSKPA